MVPGKDISARSAGAPCKRPGGQGNFPHAENRMVRSPPLPGGTWQNRCAGASRNIDNPSPDRPFFCNVKAFRQQSVSS